MWDVGHPSIVNFLSFYTNLPPAAPSAILLIAVQEEVHRFVTLLSTLPLFLRRLQSLFGFVQVNWLFAAITTRLTRQQSEANTSTWQSHNHKHNIQHNIQHLHASSRVTELLEYNLHDYNHAAAADIGRRGVPCSTHSP
jgi:hypothetical protein